ncbi:MAG: STAS domain-containing protein [Anaerolineales bacterium]|nr:STAS domain-containing protein [Anaerolineales bacterium]
MSELKIAKESLHRVDLITVSGRVNSESYTQLDAALNDARDSVALNLAGVSYMSSAGVRVLVAKLRDCRQSGGSLVLSQPSDKVTEVLELTGLTALFSTFDNDTAAVGSF